MTRQLLHAPLRQSKHRRTRRANGLCGREGCQKETGTAYYYCPKHREEQAARMRAYREARGARPRRRKRTYWGQR